MLKLQAGVKARFFSALGVEILVEPNGQMCEKHFKYACFLKVPHVCRNFAFWGSGGSLLDVVLAAFWKPGGANP